MQLSLNTIKESISCKEDTLDDINDRNDKNPDFQITRVIRALYLPDKALPADIALLKSAYSSYQNAKDNRANQPADQKLKEYIMTLAEFKTNAISTLKAYPFWPSIPKDPLNLTDDDYCMQAITFWSENHIFMHLSAAYLFYY